MVDPSETTRKGLNQLLKAWYNDAKEEAAMWNYGKIYPTTVIIK